MAKSKEEIKKYIRERNKRMYDEYRKANPSIIHEKKYNFKILVSKQDEYLLKEYKWNFITARQKEKKFYVAAAIAGKTVYLHRLIMNCPDGMVVDHKDGNPLNCTRSNMRIVTQSENCLNRAVHRV